MTGFDHIKDYQLAVTADGLVMKLPRGCFEIISVAWIEATLCDEHSGFQFVAGRQTEKFK